MGEGDSDATEFRKDLESSYQPSQKNNNVLGKDRCTRNPAEDGFENQRRGTAGKDGHAISLGDKRDKG